MGLRMIQTAGDCGGKLRTSTRVEGAGRLEGAPLSIFFGEKCTRVRIRLIFQEVHVLEGLHKWWCLHQCVTRKSR